MNAPARGTSVIRNSRSVQAGTCFCLTQLVGFCNWSLLEKGCHRRGLGCDLYRPSSGLFAQAGPSPFAKNHMPRDANPRSMRNVQILISLSVGLPFSITPRSALKKLMNVFIGFHPTQPLISRLSFFFNNSSAVTNSTS